MVALPPTDDVFVFGVVRFVLGELGLCDHKRPAICNIDHRLDLNTPTIDRDNNPVQSLNAIAVVGLREHPKEISPVVKEIHNCAMCTLDK